MKKIVLAADVGGTNLRMAAVGDDGEILHRTKKKTPRYKNGSEILGALYEKAEECKEKLSNCKVEAIAVAVPGTVDVDTGIIIKAPNLPELNGFEIARALERKMSIRAVLENDANAAAIGENWLGASKGLKNSIMLTLGTGVGGGLIIEGRIIRGIDGTAGELGHICVQPDGYECGCGSRGCVEQYASATAVVKMAKDFVASSESEQAIELQKDWLTSKDVYDFAKRGNEIALEVFRQQGFYLGILLGGLVNTLNPEVIVIGGGASVAWDLFIGKVKEQIGIRAFLKPTKRAKLLRAELGDDAGILGAAFLGFENKPDTVKLLI